MTYKSKIRYNPTEPVPVFVSLFKYLSFLCFFVAITFNAWPNVFPFRLPLFPATGFYFTITFLAKPCLSRIRQLLPFANLSSTALPFYE